MTLTHNEAAVIDILRTFGRLTEVDGSLPVSTIKNKALDRAGVRYDQVDRALRGLISLGLVERPRRGYYRAKP